ncbi:MAG: hypothetical protein O7B99_02880, partial [Planctomycetota bacterium]|nr:hypothetical protein [Planctomycetota bacterium]
WNPEKKKLTTGLIQEGRLIQIQNDIAAGDTMGLHKLITTDGMFEHYTWGWSLVHFLMNDGRYAKKFQKFFTGLAKGKDVKREFQGFSNLRTVAVDEVWNAFRKYLGLKSDEDVTELEQEWHDYVKTQLELVSPRGKEKAAVSAMNSGRNIRARRLFQEAIEAGTRNAVTFHKYAEFLQRKGEKGAAVENWRKAIELDPLTGEFYYALGRALEGRDEEEEGKRLKALGLELDPEAGGGWWE